MVGDVLVLGGGLAGASAALQLARAGWPVQLIERTEGAHHKVCGEFLSVEAQGDLRRIGLEPMELGAVPVDRVRIVRGRRKIECPLPFTALGVSRSSLDEALIERACKSGAEVRRGVKVLEVSSGEVNTSAGAITGRAIVLASGKHDVRGLPRQLQEGAADYVGFKMHWAIPAKADAAIGNAVELVSFAGGYVGLQRVAPRVMNLCAIIRRDVLENGGGVWQNLLREFSRDEHLACRLDGAQPLFERPLTIARLPYGFVHQPDKDMPGLFRVGDQAALTAPLTGDGMAIALRSAALASGCMIAGGSPQEYSRKLRDAVVPQVHRAMLLHKAANSPSLLQVSMAVLGLRPNLLGKLAAMTRLNEARAT